MLGRAKGPVAIAVRWWLLSVPHPGPLTLQEKFCALGNLN